MSTSFRKGILRAFNLFCRPYYNNDQEGKAFKATAARDYVLKYTSELRSLLPKTSHWRLEELAEMARRGLESAPLRFGDDDKKSEEEEDDPQINWLDKIGDCFIDDDGRPVKRAPGHLKLEQYRRRLVYLEDQRDRMSAGLAKEKKLFEENEKAWKEHPDWTLNELLGRDSPKKVA